MTFEPMCSEAPANRRSLTAPPRMFDHPAVDVALGLALLYIVLSLVASVVKEWISTAVGLRARNLRRGIETLVGPDYALKLYGHPLVSTLAKDQKIPSYIEARTFATVLVDLLATDDKGNPVVNLQDQADALVARISPGSSLEPTLRALARGGADTVDDLRQEIAAWFDEGMNRVSGWYRRRTQLIILAIGAAVTVFANASTVHVVQDLWRDDALRAAVARQAVEAADAANAANATAGQDTPAPSLDSPPLSAAALESFPLGWEGQDPFGLFDDIPNWGWTVWFTHLIGWLFTAAAVSLGAPFWFDLLGKVASIRGTGARPGKTGATGTG